MNNTGGQQQQQQQQLLHPRIVTALVLLELVCTVMGIYFGLVSFSPPWTEARCVITQCVENYLVKLELPHQHIHNYTIRGDLINCQEFGPTLPANVTCYVTGILLDPKHIFLQPPHNIWIWFLGLFEFISCAGIAVLVYAYAGTVAWAYVKQKHERKTQQMSSKLANEAEATIEINEAMQILCVEQE